MHFSPIIFISSLGGGGGGCPFSVHVENTPMVLYRLSNKRSGMIFCVFWSITYQKLKSTVEFIRITSTHKQTLEKEEKKKLTIMKTVPIIMAFFFTSVFTGTAEKEKKIIEEHSAGKIDETELISNWILTSCQPHRITFGRKMCQHQQTQQINELFFLNRFVSNVSRSTYVLINSCCCHFLSLSFLMCRDQHK